MPLIKIISFIYDWIKRNINILDIVIFVTILNYQYTKSGDLGFSLFYSFVVGIILILGFKSGMKEGKEWTKNKLNKE